MTEQARGPVRADPAELSVALDRVAALSPYFALSTGPDLDGPGWHRTADLLHDPVVLDGLVTRIGARIGATERRVAASIFFQGHAARLWSVAVGVWRREGVVLDLQPDVLCWRDDDGSVSLHLEHPTGWVGGGATELREQVLTAHLLPLVAALQQGGAVNEAVLWGNAASALLGAAQLLDGAGTGPAHQLVDPLLRTTPLTGTVVDLGDGTHRRRTCCLYYRLPGAGCCGDCVLTHRPATRVRG